MFLKINTVETNPLLSRGVHALSGASSLVGVITDTTRNSRRKTKQFRALQARLRRMTRDSSDDLRNDVFSYGEAHFWGHQAHVDLPFGFDRIVDWHIAQVKKTA